MAPGRPDGPAPETPRALIVQRGATGRAIARHLRDRGVAPLVMDAPDEARHALAWAAPEIAIVEVGGGDDAWTLLDELRQAGSRTFALGPERPSPEVERRARGRGVGAVVAATTAPERIAAQMLGEPEEEEAGPETQVLVRGAAARASAGAWDPAAPGPRDEPDPLDLSAELEDPIPEEDGDPDTRVSGPPPMEEVAQERPPARPAPRGPSTAAVIAAGLRGRARLRRLAATAVGAVATVVVGLAAFQLIAGPSDEAAMAEALPEVAASGAGESAPGEGEPAEPGGEEGVAEEAAPRAAREPEVERVPVPTSTDQTNLLNYGEGILAQRAGQRVDAARSYRYVLRNDGYHPGALAGLADALIRGGHLDDARPVLERLVRVRADDPEAHLGLGLVTASLGDRDVARRGLERFLELAPDDPRRRDVRRLLASLASASP